MAQGSSVSLVFSALVVMATAGSYPEVKNVVDKKCVECYGHIANAYLECIQASIKHPLHPERAAEECTKAQNDALTFCPDYCMKKPEPPHPGPPHPGPPIPGPPIPGPPEPPTPEPVEEISYNLDPEEDVPVTYDQLITLQSFLENNKPDEDTVSPKCRLCYGRIASAFIDCMKGTYDHPHRPKMVELLCNQAVKKANKACSKETCISASGGSKCNTAAADIKTLSTEDFVLQEKGTSTESNELNMISRKKRYCPEGTNLCVAKMSGKSTCCLEERACCGQFKSKVKDVCCPPGFCCNARLTFYVTSCVPPMFC